MKVLHVITTIARDGGGPSRSVQGLVAALEKTGVEAWLLSLTPGEQPWLAGVTHFCCAEHSGWRGASEAMTKAVQRIRPDLVHFHKIWDIPLHAAVHVARKRKIPYVCAPRGSLEPWSLRQKALKKRLARWIYQDSDLRGAVALHATADSEAQQFRKLGFSNRILISPNGVNLPEADEAAVKIGGSCDGKRMLFVSRLHPKKGVLELVNSWARVRNQGVHEIMDWTCELVYTVRDEAERSYENDVRARVAALGLENNFIFTGALDDEAKWGAYKRADVFVLPTYSENFGIVVAEALWMNLPVITTRGAPWSDIEESTSRCGWWVDLPDASLPWAWSALEKALHAVVTQPVEERKMWGRNGHLLVARKYLWQSLAQKMKLGYEELLGV